MHIQCTPTHVHKQTSQKIPYPLWHLWTHNSLFWSCLRVAYRDVSKWERVDLSPQGQFRAVRTCRHRNQVNLLSLTSWEYHTDTHPQTYMSLLSQTTPLNHTLSTTQGNTTLFNLRENGAICLFQHWKWKYIAFVCLFYVFISVFSIADRLNGFLHYY